MKLNSKLSIFIIAIASIYSTGVYADSETSISDVLDTLFNGLAKEQTKIIKIKGETRRLEIAIDQMLSQQKQKIQFSNQQYQQYLQSGNQQFAATVSCITPQGVCSIPATVPLGVGCYCNTPYGQVTGVVRYER